MFHCQLIVLFILFITTICIAWPLDGDDDSKPCFHFTGLQASDAKCSANCIKKGKTGGTCDKKRCVCNSQSNKDKNKENETKSRQLSFSINSTLNIGVLPCRAHCKNIGKLDGSVINGLCVCSRL